VLVVDDEENLRHLLRVILERAGFEVLEACGGHEALTTLEANPTLHLVLCDIRMPRMDGLAFLEATRGRGLSIVMMSAYGTTRTAVDALTRGAVDYISKPFRAEEIRICLERILERAELEAENLRLRQTVQGTADLEGFIGRTPAVRELLETVRRIAPYPSTVLITGESGTGKELLARALHRLSPREAFVAVNCAAIPESLLESELFGHERGAFTGAVRSHAGLFEQAHQGTLLLDEIGEMPAGLQTRLLRVLESREVRRLGGRRDISIDVRVLAATARDLQAAVQAGTFRRDLYYRLNVVHIAVPPLRERREDIPVLAEALVTRAATRLRRSISGLSVEALRALVPLAWPGNVRQLENALERAVLMARGDRVEQEDLPRDLFAIDAAPSGDLSIKRRCAELERQLITEALRRTEGNRTQAARLLEISYKALLYKIRDYGITP